jgi:large repetitive protein
VPYEETLDATGGTGALVWSLTAGSLPTNVMLAPGGTISGTPTVVGTSNFTVKVTDALAQSDTQSLSIAVSAILAITTASPLPDAEVGKSYNKTLARSGGVAPFSWTVTPPLPTGLTLEASSGKITGIPAAGTDGSYILTFTVKDSSAPIPQAAIKSLTLKIKP